MHAINTKVSSELYERIDKLSILTDRTKSYILKKAIEFYLDEKEEYIIDLHQREQQVTTKIKEFNNNIISN